ncbi:hypothetical protein ACFV9C_06015 [Kribbella sp. NPDC059898]|uniref:hypothetical protein n=1 Tax=Kribbella sp. NPDC059898 TaxID=3346995 RepID=UPI003658131D
MAAGDGAAAASYVRSRAGSVRRTARRLDRAGNADRWSDAEIGVFWETAPTELARSELATAGGARDSRLFEYDAGEQVWCDDLYLGVGSPAGLLVEVVHQLAAATSQVLDAVLVDHSPDPAALNVVDGLLDGMPFHGVDLLSGWRERAAMYPRELAVAVIESAGVIDHFWRWEMLIERRNPVLFAGLLSSVSQQLLTMLLALNRRYGPKHKWLPTNLDLAPDDLDRRLRQVFAVAPANAAEMLAELVEETFTLVETELPEVDITRLRAIFRHRRPPLDHPPLAQ